MGLKYVFIQRNGFVQHTLFYSKLVGAVKVFINYQVAPAFSLDVNFRLTVRFVDIGVALTDRTFRIGICRCVTK